MEHNSQSESSNNEDTVVGEPSWPLGHVPGTQLESGQLWALIGVVLPFQPPERDGVHKDDPTRGHKIENFAN